METSRNVKRKKILIVKLSALGDIAHALPVVDYIREHIPDTEIDWVVEERFKELLASHPLINHIYTVDTRALRRHFLSTKTVKFLSDLSKELSQRSYDVALDLQGNIKSAFFTILSRAPRRYGFSKPDVREFPNLLATNIKSQTSAKSIREKLMGIARAFLKDEGISEMEGENFWNRPLRYLIDQTELIRQREFLTKNGWKGEPVVGIIHGTTWKTKMWHPKRWVELVEIIHKNKVGRSLIFWGNREELAFSERLIAEINGRSISEDNKPILWSGGNIKSLIAALSLTRVVIGPDTGPLHIAALIGTPTISFYRSTNPARSAPLGPFHFAIKSPLSCSPCFKKECKDDELCSDSIPAVELVGAIKCLNEEWNKALLLRPS